MCEISDRCDEYVFSDRNEWSERCLDTQAAVVDKLKRQKKDGSQTVP